MKILLPSVYNGNIAWFSQLIKADTVMIEQHEHFVKQTYRNRCEIYGANGKLDLIIPIKRGRNERTTMNNARIDNTSRWQTLHWRSIESGYRRSPYFEYYEDKFRPFYEDKYDSLLEYNLATTRFLLSLLKIEKEISLTKEYEKTPEGITDMRDAFDPKKNNFSHRVYTQVFETKYGFIPNLSVIDVLFNCGPQALQYLQS